MYQRNIKIKQRYRQCYYPLKLKIATLNHQYLIRTHPRRSIPEDDVLLKRYTGTIKETSTPAIKGNLQPLSADADTLNIDGQYPSYVVYPNKTSDATNTLTYADDQLGPRTIELTGSHFQVQEIVKK